jgi:hypothetical protein
VCFCKEKLKKCWEISGELQGSFVSHKFCCVFSKNEEDKIDVIFSDSGSHNAITNKIPEFEFITRLLSTRGNLGCLFLNKYARLEDIGCTGFAIRDAIYYAKLGRDESLRQLKEDLSIETINKQNKRGEFNRYVSYEFPPQLVKSSQFTKEEYGDKSLVKYIERNAEKLSIEELSDLRRISEKESNIENDQYVYGLERLIGALHTNDIPYNLRRFGTHPKHTIKNPRSETRNINSSQRTT